MNFLLRIILLFLIYKTTKALFFYQLDFVIVLDSNKDVTAEAWMLQKQFISGILLNIIAKVGICDVKVAVVNYGSHPEVVWDFNSPNARDKTLIYRDLITIPKIGGQAKTLADVLDTVRSNVLENKGNRKSVPNFVLFMNSRPAKSTKGLNKAARKLHKLSKILVVGVTNQTNTDEIMTLAQNDDKYVANVNEFLKIQNAVQFVKGTGNPLVMDCNAKCRDGFTNKDVAQGQSYYKLTLKHGKKTVSLDTTNILIEGKHLEIPPHGAELCVSPVNKGLFVVKTLCWNTVSVEKMSLKGLDENGGKKLTKTMHLSKDGQGCRKFRSQIKQEPRLLKSLCMKFSAKKGHPGKVTIADIYIDGCAKD